MGAMFSNTSILKKNRNTWLNLFILLVTVIVAVRHASMPDWLGKGYAAFDAFGKALIWITEVCLPLFFILAGYLIFRGTPSKPDLSWYGQKYLCGLKRIVIPFLIVNILTWLVYAAAYKFTPSVMSGFLDGNWKDPFFVLWKGPINLALWFMREVIVAFLFFPVLYLLIRYTWGIGVIALGVLWRLNIIPETLFWLSLGAALAILPIRIKRLNSWMDQHSLRIPADCFDWCYFVYLYHYIPQIAMKKLGVMLLPEINSAGLITVWVLNALLLLGGLSAVYLLLRRFTPKLLSVLVGSW